MTPNEGSSTRGSNTLRVGLSTQTACAVAPVASLQAFTSVHRTYATHYRPPFAICNFLCPLAQHRCLRSGCPRPRTRAGHWVYLVSLRAPSAGLPTVRVRDALFTGCAIENGLQGMTCSPRASHRFGTWLPPCGRDRSKPLNFHDDSDERSDFFPIPNSAAAPSLPTREVGQACTCSVCASARVV